METLKIKARFYRSYPMDVSAAHPALGHLGEDETVLDIPKSQAVVAGMHLWNIGEPDGPDVTPHGPDWSITKLYDFYRDAARALNENIGPILKAARKAGLPVVHVATSRYAHHYPQYRQTVETYGEESRSSLPVCLDRSWRDQFTRHVFGSDVDAVEISRVKNKIRVSRAAAPAPSDHMVINDNQFTHLLRGLNANTIFYVGFATNACLLFIGRGGIHDMKRLGYRIILVRDATAALEEKQTALSGANQQTAIRWTERHFGYSCASRDLLAALAG